MPPIVANSELITSSAVPRAQLWFGLLGGALAWAAHFISAYLLAEFGCVGGLAEYRFANVSYVAWLEIAVTAVAVLVAFAATMLAYRSSRRLQSRPPVSDDALHGEPYLARAGLYTSAIFTFVILFEAIPLFFYFRHC
jgi:hypothetical protein